MIGPNLERNFDSDGEFHRLTEQAKTASAKIRHKDKNAEMSEFISQAEGNTA